MVRAGDVVGASRTVKLTQFVAVSLSELRAFWAEILAFSTGFSGKDIAVP
jgi:hypothetical protein